jgi:RNA polymerase sigma-70 factor (ECF subfamily)
MTSPRGLHEGDVTKTDFVHTFVNRTATADVFSLKTAFAIDVDEHAANSSGRSEDMDGPDVADVEAAAAGDVAAFEKVVRVMQGPVWRYLVHLVRDHALAEDVSQEVFIRCYRKLHTLNDPQRFVPWLLATARNAAFDAGRARKRRPLELVGDDEMPSPPQGDPQIGIEIRDALDRLDETLREALVLVGIIGLSYAEAAEAIGVPEGTVKSRTFRARRALIEMLEAGADDVR